GIDHSEQLHDRLDTIEGAERLARGRQQPEPHQPGAAVALLYGYRATDLTGEMIAVLVERSLPSHEEKPPGEPDSHSIGYLRRHRRQLDSEFLKSLFRPHRPFSSSVATPYMASRGSQTGYRRMEQGRREIRLHLAAQQRCHPGVI